MRMSRGALVGVISVAILLALGGIAWAGRSLNAPPPPDSVICTADAKQCPDGTWVGRTGPRCEFVCSDNSPTSSTPRTVVVETTIGRSVHAIDIDLVPLKVIEDSRCPIGVECIWAGTVKVNVSIHSGLGDSTMTLALGVPVTTEAETITLVGVKPPVRTAGSTIAQNQYMLVFEVTKR